MIEELLEKFTSLNKENFTLDDIKYIIQKHFEKNELVTEHFTIETDNYSVIKNGVTIRMPRKEFLLLSYLVKKTNMVVRRKELLDKIWGTDVIVIDRTIDVHIRKIKQKLGNVPIKTVKGVGYMWKE